ncbi:MAG: LysM peptidoglycan-binding domain-containing protein [Rhodobacter sp.]|nr:LysM peptidoglycan-binding domain-containing protein [Rhodobacter sp.]
MAKDSDDIALPATAGGTGKMRVEFELMAALDIFGVPLEAGARFGPGVDTILQARFGDLSVGAVIEYLVNKAEPNFDFKLGPPWDALNKINLKNFVFQVDLTNRRAGIQYNDIGFKFPFVDLERIEIWYSPRGKSGTKSVEVSLYGSFLGKSYDSPPGLTWDVLSQPPPAVPGKGAKTFDLEYLGVGQRVTLRDRSKLNTMKDIIDALEKSYKDIDPVQNPLESLSSFKFDSSTPWLIGTKFSVLESVTLSVIFNAPNLAGLRIALDGKRVGKLAGLEFEIVYKKINDHLGLYYFQLKLPDVIRQIKLGQVNITLPIIDLWVYTNGNFKVDVGFPKGLDFSRSAAINFIVWVGPIPIPISGAAGFYFGVLSSESSTSVPAITNGSFNPVLVAGFGMRLGLGYSIQLGILDAGFFVGFFGIFEGTLAFFHPNSPSVNKAVFFKLSATIGIMGHIWGTVNFAIIKASVDIFAYAKAQLVIEIYAPVEVTFEAGVSVKLRVKILFIHITLSFHATIRKTFTMGSQQATPWALAQDGGAAQSRQGLRATSQGLVADSFYTGILQQDFRSHAESHLEAAISLMAEAPQPATTIPLKVQLLHSVGRTDDLPAGLVQAPAVVVANADAAVLNAGVALDVAGHSYTTAAGDTFAKIAQATSASLAAVATAAGPAAGLMTEGKELAVPQGGGTYKIAANQTLNAILAALPNEALAVEQVATLLIGSHGAMWEALAVANATTTGLLVAGVEIAFPSAKHTITDTDTFQSVTDALNVADPNLKLTVAGLADYFQNNDVPLHQGEAMTLPEGTTTLSGGTTTVPSGATLGATSKGLMSPFERLARAAFDWSLKALNHLKEQVPAGMSRLALPTEVPLADLHAIYQHLTDDTKPIELATIVTFLKAQSVDFVLDKMPAAPQNPQFGVFPMLPYLAVSSAGTKSVDYATEPYQSDAEYRAFIAAYFEKLAAPSQPGPNDGSEPPLATSLTAAGTVPDSIAADMFTDFFVVVLRQVVQDAIDLYREYTYTPASGQTLAEIAAQFGLSDLSVGRMNEFVPGLIKKDTQIAIGSGQPITVGADDDLSSIAEALGVTVEAVEGVLGKRPVVAPGVEIFLLDEKTYVTQDGDSIDSLEALQVPVTPEIAVARIATANHDTKGFFAKDSNLEIVEHTAAVITGDTLRDFAARLQTTPLLVAQAFKDRTGVLTQGDQITVTGARAAIALDATIASTVTELGLPKDQVYAAMAPIEGLLHPYVTIQVPAKDTTAYLTQPSDSLDSIAKTHGITAAALADAIATQTCLVVPGTLLSFDMPVRYTVRGSGNTSESPQAIARTLGTSLANIVGQPGNAAALNLTVGTKIEFGLTAQVRSGESLTDFAGRFGLDPVAVATSARLQPGFLEPGATLKVSGGRYIIGASDTLASIAAMFNTAGSDLVDVNRNVVPCFPPAPPAKDWSKTLAAPLPVGYEINLPDNLKYTVQSGDTLRGIADFFSVELDAVLTENALKNKALLMTQAQVALPVVHHKVADGDTPASIAGTYGLSLDRLVLVNQGAGVTFGPMIVPDAQILQRSVLDSELQDSGRFDASSGSLARFMLHGLRLPTPEEIHDSGLTAAGLRDDSQDASALTLYPMYSILGQQWMAPTDPATAGPVTFTFSTATPPDGFVSFAGGGDSLAIDLTHDEAGAITKLWTQLGEADPINPHVLAKTALPPYAVAPKRFALGQPVDWSAPVPPAYIHDPDGACKALNLEDEAEAKAEAPAAGQPRLYPFPPALRQAVNATPGAWVDELVAVNATLEGLLAPGIPIALPSGGSYTTQAGDTFQKIVDGNPGLTLATLADAAADIAGLLIPRTVVTLPKGGQQQVRENDTLSSLAYAYGAPIWLNLEVASRRTPSSPTETEQLTEFGWATQIKFGLRRATDPAIPDAFLQSTYEVYGTDEVAIHDLQHLLDYVMDGGRGATLTIDLLYPENPGTTSPGLRSDTIQRDEIWLLKANLSTRTNPPVAPTFMAAGPNDEETDQSVTAAATMAPASADDFLKLLWEASITNTGGYYLYYKTAGKNGKGLPDEVFGQDPTAEITLLITVTETAGATSTIPVRPFHNVALVTQNIANAKASLLVVPPECPIGDTATLASTAAKLGVSVQALGLANATTQNLLIPGQTITADGASYTVNVGDDLLAVALATGKLIAVVIDAVAQQAGLLHGGALIQIYPTWLERSPTVLAGAAGFRMLRADPDEDATNDKVRAEALTAQENAATQLEVLYNLVGYRLVANDDFEQSPEGLPAGPTTQDQGESNHDTQAGGIAPPWTYNRQLAIARFATVQPVGRKVPGQDPYAAIDKTVEFSIQFQDMFGNRFLAGDGETMSSEVLYQDELIALANWPAVVTTYAFAAPAKSDEAPTMHVDVAFDAAQYIPPPGDSFAGSAQLAEGHRKRYAEIYFQVAQDDVTITASTTVDGGKAHPLTASQFAEWAASAYAYLGTVAAMTQVTVKTTNDTTMGAIVKDWAVDLGDVASANRNCPVGQESCQNLLKLNQNLTLRYLYSTVINDTLGKIAAGLPKDWGGPTDPETVARRNADVTLEPGVVLAVGAPYTVAKDDTLASIAKAAGRTVQQIAFTNVEVAGLLTPDAIVQLPAPTNAVTSPGDTLETIAQRFQSQSITVDGLVAANAERANLLTPGEKVVIDGKSYDIKPGFTFAVLAQLSGKPLTDIAAATAEQKDLIAPNIGIVVPTVNAYQIAEGDSIRTVSNVNEQPVTVVANAMAALKGLLTVGTAITIPSDYAIKATDTFDTVAKHFGRAASDLAGANSQTPGIFRPKARVALPEGASWPVAYQDSFQSVADAAGVLLARFAEASANTRGLLIAGAKVAIGGEERTIQIGDTLANLAQEYGTPVLKIVQDNATAQILQPGAGAQLPSGARAEVGANATLETLAAAYRTTPGDLAEANATATGLLTTGAHVAARYTTQKGDSLGKITTALGLNIKTLADSNAAVANLFPSDSALDLATKPYAIEVGDTFESIAKTHQISVEDIGRTNPDAKIFNSGKSLNIPRHVAMGKDTTATGPVPEDGSLAALSTETGRPVSDLAMANQDLKALVAAGVKLSYKTSLPPPAKDQTFSETSATNDTLSTITARFQTQIDKWRAATPDTPRISVTAADVAEQNKAVKGLLTAKALVVLPPKALQNAVDVPATLADYPGVIFEVDATVRISRDAKLVNPRMINVPGVVSADSPLRADISPDSVQGNEPMSGAQQFAKDFEAAFHPDLKLANGSSQTGASSGDAARDTLYAVQNQTKDFDYSIEGSSPHFFAPPPLQRTLWHSESPIPIQPYITGQGLGPAVPKSFSGIDLDTWGREFLAALDLALSADYAVPAYSLDPDAYLTLVNAKNGIARAIRNAVIEVLDPAGDAAAATPANLDAAREALYQRLLIQLSTAYEVDTIIQLPVQVTAPATWRKGTSPRFFGQPVGSTYEIPAKATLAAVAKTKFKAPVSVLGRVASDYAYILTPGLPVPGVGSYTVTAGDTLASIAALYSNTPGNVAEGAASVKGLLASGIAIALSNGSTYTTKAGDTFAGIAAALKINVQALGADAAVVSDLLTAGVKIPVPAYTILPSDTLSTLAIHMRTDVTGLVDALKDTEGLLHEGAQLNLVTRSYSVASDDTLDTVIDYLSLAQTDSAEQDDAVATFAEMNAAVKGLFKSVSEQHGGGPVTIDVHKPYTIAEGDSIDKIVQNTGGASSFDLAKAISHRSDVLMNGVVITEKANGSGTYTTRLGDTLQSIADLLGIALKALIDDWDTASSTKLLRVGAVIGLPGRANVRHHTIAPDDTLATIAEAIAKPTPRWDGVTPEWIVKTQLYVADLVSPGVPVSFLTRVPGFTLSDAKIELYDSSGPDGPSSLNVLFTSASNTAFKNLSIDLSYQVNQLEYDVQDLPWAEGYQASQWLSYIIPPQDTPGAHAAAEIGTVDVPIPLRAYPVPPSMVSQDTKPTVDSYRTQPGDTLGRVAQSLGGIAVEAASNLLSEGASLDLPRVTQIAVEPHETVETLAARSGRDLAEVSRQMPASPRSHVMAVPETYIVEAGDTLYSIADKTGTTPEQLLCLNADAPAIVRPGIEISAASEDPTLAEIRNYSYEFIYTYVRAAQDTLIPSWQTNVPGNTPFAMQADARTLPDVLAQFSEISTALGADLSRLTSVKPRTLTAAKTAAGDTLRTLGSPAGASPGYVASVNAEVTGLLTKGAKIELPNQQSYTVKAGDTFASISKSTGASLWTIGQAAGELTGLLAEGVEISLPLPNTQVAWQALRVLAGLAKDIAPLWLSWTLQNQEAAERARERAAPALARPQAQDSGPADPGLVSETAEFELRSGTDVAGRRHLQITAKSDAAHRTARTTRTRMAGLVPAASTAPLAQSATLMAAPPAPRASSVPAPTQQSNEVRDGFSKTVPDLDIISTQNIWGRVRVQRNTTLLARRTTNELFVYSTPNVQMPNKAIPLIKYSEPFDMTSVVPGLTPPRPLANWLAHFFAGLLDGYVIHSGDTFNSVAAAVPKATLADVAAAAADIPDLLVIGTKMSVPGKPEHTVAVGDTLAAIAAAQSVEVLALVQANADLKGLLFPGVPVNVIAITREIRVSVDYGFDLARAGTQTTPGDQGEQILTRKPVYLRPSFPFDSSTNLAPDKPGLVHDLAQKLIAWAEQQKLDQNTGIWIFDVSLYTSLPGGDEQQIPLLEMNNIQLPRSSITPKS